MATVAYDTKTGKKLSAGQTTSVGGVTYKAGDTLGSPSSSSGGGGSSSSSSSSSNIVNYNPNNGQQLKPGESVINAATGQIVTQGQPFSSGSSSSSSSQIINYNPNDGSKLSAGQTVLDNNTGKYVTQGTALGTTSSTPPKPTGINAVTSILNMGSQGSQVTELQKYLRDTGQPNLTVDGIFGPETKAAVMQFQSQNGLVPDGIVGPLTVTKLKTLTSTDAQINSAAPGTSAPATKAPDDPSYEINPETGLPNPNYNPNANATPFNTGDPVNDALLQTLQDFIKAQQDAGLTLNESLNFDQATLDKFLETAKKQVHPFYQQQIDAIKADVLHAAPQILENYGSDIAGAESKFQNDLGTSRENYAGSGLAFSGARAKGEFGMADQQNRDLTALSQGYGNKLYDLGRTAESKIGASATPSLGSLSNYSANLSGNGGFQLGGSYTPYTSGGYQIGSLTNDEEAAIEARNQALKKSASESVVAGRDYSDLFA